MNMVQLLRKYFIMGSQNVDKTQNPEVVLEEALNAGVTAFQFREKGPGALMGEDKIALGKRLRSLCREYDVPFFINDDVELAKVLDVDGIHVGQDDMPVAQLREMFPELMIGLSISNATELAKSNLAVIDYIGAGPIFSTRTKKDAKDSVGLDWIKTLRKQQPHFPIVGIGGIDETNAKQVIDAGTDGVAIISAITTSRDIKNTVSAL